MIGQSTIDLVRISFAQASSSSDDFILGFYRNLFEAAPEIRPLFPDDLADQAKSLRKKLTLSVSKLDKFDQLVVPLQDLGADHVAYGVRPEHYPIVAEALIETLATALGTNWTEDHRKAWHLVLMTIAEIMLSGAQKRATDAA